MTETKSTATWKEWQGLIADGTFPLNEYLGGTGHSAVYLTQWGGPDGSKAAIKLIAADWQSAEVQLSRWKFASEFPHPHLLRIFQAGRCEFDGVQLLYVVMEYAEENLSEILLQRRLNEQEAREAISDVLEALTALHREGLVHGHLKPGNIMAAGNQLKLSSDSIARAGSTTAGCASPYDAPEAADGKLAPAADIWALGMTLVESLTQQRPGLLRNTELGNEDGEPAIPPALPGPFGKIAEQCLRRDPSCRWSVAEIQKHLSPQQPEIAPVKAPEVPAARRIQQKVVTPISSLPATPKAARNSAKTYAAAVLAAGLLLAAGAAVFTTHHANPQQGTEAASVSSISSDASPAASSSAASSSAQQPAQAVETADVRKPTRAQAMRSPNPASQASASQAQAVQPSPLPEAMSAPPSPSLVPGSVIERPLPDVPQKIRRTIHGRVKVKVKVAVDPSGGAQRVVLDSRVSSDYFARIAMETARRWRFTPVQRNGRNVASNWILNFEFDRNRTKVRPVPLRNRL